MSFVCRGNNIFPHSPLLSLIEPLLAHYYSILYVPVLCLRKKKTFKAKCISLYDQYGHVLPREPATGVNKFTNSVLPSLFTILESLSLGVMEFIILSVWEVFLDYRYFILSTHVASDSGDQKCTGMHKAFLIYFYSFDL